MKRPLAIAATLALLAGAIYAGRNRDGNQVAGQAAADSPAGCLERMFAAAEKGDIGVWLDCFTGGERGRLARQAESQPAEKFAASLQQAVRTLKGRAISGADASQLEGDVASLSVERIYAHHTERQSYHFRREPDGWRIDSVGAVEKHEPPIAYGTPVYDLGSPGEE